MKAILFSLILSITGSAPTKYIDSPYRSVGQLKVGNYTGTAFGVADNYLVSAGHLCAHAASTDTEIGLWVLLPDGHKLLTKADIRVVAIDYYNDLCLLRSSYSVLDTLPLAKRAPKHDDRVLIMGAPKGLLGIVTEGRVARPRINLKREEQTYMLISVPTTSGNSGSPVLNKHGRVVGVLVAGYPSYSFLSLATPLFELKTFLEKEMK